MRFTLEYPIERTGYAPEFRLPENLARVVRAAEEAGFGAICFSEHPAPSTKWLAAGGHHTFDPLAALSFCAGVTSRIRLMTNLLVLPYRNPLLTAKTLSTVDVLSGGRLTVVAGSGYLRSEFAALGVDFAERNELFDEAVEVLAKAWTGEPVRFEGRHFRALDQQLRPPPVQAGLPLWIGGNSKAARRRVVAHGQGWSPLFAQGVDAKTVRTSPIETVEQLASAIDELRGELHEAGRSPDSVDVQTEAPVPAVAGGDPEAAAHLDELAKLASAGVTWALVRLPADGVDSALDAIGHYGEDFIRASEGERR
ncbi:LLM class F420-dependent oxidoreductase [Amycolatopsis acidiphila]|uniref:LLM class F420-dependent oxidoreductase n=1 Tax=Amycolatopsis acidiphila TaxID=715473 RepID=A0A558AP13_9PSEU|nr:LLM class F420-dependent oxidoreductase [Amycolatopsis acidiphila]TVT26006.1 LLM class F420-dependent oxidoreductase [Amycolatopsis acidiphila]UIJ63280.1 LLM class F420-dependent oxidoreductase [Amycolatopsis acidiphila]GHG74753.1 LLM class F420-dependent oxidoreductase [Amycolatopsis acidiphila]